MLTNHDQQFLVQLAGYIMGMAGAGVIALYLFYRLFRGVENTFWFLMNLIPTLVKKKKVVE